MEKVQKRFNGILSTLRDISYNGGLTDSDCFLWNARGQEENHEKHKYVNVLKLYPRVEILKTRWQCFKVKREMLKCGASFVLQER